MKNACAVMKIADTIVIALTGNRERISETNTTTKRFARTPFPPNACPIQYRHTKARTNFPRMSR